MNIEAGQVETTFNRVSIVLDKMRFSVIRFVHDPKIQQLSTGSSVTLSSLDVASRIPFVRESLPNGVADHLGDSFIPSLVIAAGGVLSKIIYDCGQLKNNQRMLETSKWLDRFTLIAAYFWVFGLETQWFPNWGIMKESLPDALIGFTAIATTAIAMEMVKTQMSKNGLVFEKK
ncbi:hypothetical protein A3D78_04195 [Candidatus Gottesmanbacteria bacterium RIFCSPHIGHO2_02_FULL_39_14]|uniref:Uncharacterized protein n=2 Tax=Candidatus Gottesmaniibacteriota TaxID=1752720 RepID=A0A1F5ZY24_9BACT|nr:MAG: hypothetical protein A3D78_04195 [Candidatus Gottesmanbacteria bacterium RIFCSPHIGHO2_02_FULL_39_14]OGG30924.1 MAG: hypothetical protein A3I51_01290 [Candidatus Gottesmanbacteria bacterium RIFCSPLOWO2_02_FULL_38_8]